MTEIPKYELGKIRIYPVNKGGRDYECLGFTIGGDKGDLKCSSAFFDSENGTVTLYGVELHTWLKKDYIKTKAQKETLADNIFYESWNSVGLDTLSGKEV